MPEILPATRYPTSSEPSSRHTAIAGYELERRLGHRSQRYIQRYTNPPEEVAASYVEEF
jgi:hypothetical protein